METALPIANDVVNFKGADGDKGMIHRCKMVSKFETSQLRVILWNGVLRIGTGDTPTGTTAAITNAKTSVEIRGTNAGLFTFGGKNLSPYDFTVRISDPLNAALKAGETFFPRFLHQKFSNAKPVTYAATRTPDRNGSSVQNDTVQAQYVVDSAQSLRGVGSIGGYGNYASIPIVLGLSKNPNQRAFCIEGDSVANGGAGAPPSSPYPSQKVEGAGSSIERALFAKSIPYLNTSRSAESLFQRFPQRQVAGLVVPGVDKGREAIIGKIGFTDIIVSSWPNDISRFGGALGQDGSKLVEAYAEVFGKMLSRAKSKGCRLWFVMGPLATEWKGTSKPWSTSLSEAQFLDAQVPQLLATTRSMGTTPDAVRLSVVGRLAKMASTAGNAWVIDPYMGYTHKKNRRGEWVWAKPGGSAGTTDGVHPSFVAAYGIGQILQSKVGTATQSRFPAPGLLK